jgi:hypothetical protein
MKARLLLVGALPLISFAALNCSDASFCEGAACGVVDGGPSDATVQDGGSSDAMANGDQNVPPVGCNTALDLSPQAACVTESNGLFVNASASGGGTGTRAAPFRSIQAAVAAAGGARPNIFVCAGTYAESVTLTASINLYGGFSCADWSYATTNVAKVAPANSGYALQLTGVSAATIEDLELDAMPGANAGDSSIAVFLVSSTATFSRDAISAGPAGATPPKAGTELNYPADQTTADGGLFGSGDDGRGQQTCASCLLSTTPVSVGGGSGAVGLNGGAGGPIIPGGDSSGAGGATPTTVCNNGTPGADGLDAGGGGAVTAAGSASAAGWTPATGLSGQVAPVAQGGGSGAPGSKTGGGGGGGCGGCGGGGGLGGVAGGSTFAVLSYMSDAKFSSSTLTVKAAGNGGAGGDGQRGQLGGNGGSPTLGGAGCLGASGGNGSMGGGGSGGPGGIAAAVGYVGASPTPAGLTGTTVSLPQGAATGGPGGNGGTPAAAAGAPGQVAAVVAL